MQTNSQYAPSSRFQYKIDRGVPIPAKHPRRKRVRKSKYPFHSMEIGDSFFVEIKQSSFSATVLHNAKKLDRKFTCRTVGKGTRVWRVK